MIWMQHILGQRASSRINLFRLAESVFTLLLVFALLSCSANVRAQFTPFGQTAAPQKQSKKSRHTEAAKPTDHPSIPPTLTIPAEPLGFAAPGPIYLGQRSSMASLDFLDENHLLFTFRVPGLLKRDSSFDDGNDSGERQIHALVLALPSGAIEADELWTLHDRERYLWLPGDGHFLLRDGRELKQGDLTLKLKPILRFPGTLISIGVDPLGKFLFSNSREPVAKPESTQSTHPNSQLRAQLGPGLASNQSLAFNNGGSQSEDSGQQSTTSAPKATEQESRSDATPPETVVRILDRASGKVLLVSRVRSAVQLPINSVGYAESLRDHGSTWTINLYHFDGGITRIGSVDSTCLPTLEFVADNELMATVCIEGNDTKLIALSTEGKHLWELTAPTGTIWPHLVRSANGLRIARESLAINRTINASAPLDAEDIKAQRVSVYDALTGHLVLTATASPILDAGGNLALSPSGRRVALLHAGQIEVWDLNAPQAGSEAPEDAPATLIPMTK
jgi:hypothetical protein